MNIDDIAAQSKETFVLPESVTRLKNCMDDQASTMDDIADIIGFDPSLASQLLKVANSALYRFPRTIDTISRALQVVGTRATYDLALAYGVSYAFSEVDGKTVDLDKFWEQSVSCGLLAKYFGELRSNAQSERLFVSGLLHHIGELAIVTLAPEKAKRCQDFNARVTPAQLQQSILGFYYSELSAKLIENWGIPLEISDPISHIHFTDQFDDEASRILQLSYTLALDNVNPEVYPSYHNLEERFYAPLEFNRASLEDALDITNLQCISVISLFNPSSYVLY